jgi:hypothetical protein
VASDYDQIREENIKRYGWDTAVLDLLGHLYSDRTHFLFELLQNAEDAGATEITFELFQDRLEVRHDGREFNEDDVRGVCGVGKGTKADDLTQIGKFGIGFKSVYAYTKSPQIHSGSEHFRIESYVRPFADQPVAGLGSRTLLVLPFDRDDPAAGIAVREISSALAGIEPTTLLFLRNIERVRVRGVWTPEAVLERIADSRAGGSRHIMLEKWHKDGTAAEEWLAWHRPLDAPGAPGLRTEIAFRLTGGDGERRIERVGSSPLVVYFPTQKETFLGFLIQGPYRTTPARDNIPEHDQWNQSLVRETAELVAHVLGQLRDDGLLTVDVLQTMPLDTSRFQPGTMLRPIFDAVRSALVKDRLLPLAPVGYARAGDVKLARGTGLRELLTAHQLRQLYRAETDDRPVSFAHEAITQDRARDLWEYMRHELEVDEITPESLVTRLTREFLEAQTDAWTASFYEFLQQNPALWKPTYRGDRGRPARAKPIIRLEDGAHITPFDDQGLPAAYLPGPIPTTFPTVRHAVAEKPGAQAFLVALGYSAPDVVAEVLDVVLPRYRDMAVEDLEPGQHDADIERIELALAQAASERRVHLQAQLQGTAFVIGENAKDGHQHLVRPGQLYERTAELRMYFDGNPEAWFLSDRYSPRIALFRDLGVRKQVHVKARKTNYLGFAVLAEAWGWHKRGHDGFDPDATIDGLEFAISHPNDDRSQFIWNALLAPHKHLLAGLVDSSTRQDFSNPTQEQATSPIGNLASAAAWLPSPDGSFRRPCDLALDDLPPAFRQDQALAAALGMIQPIVEQASRELNVPAHVLRALSEDPALVEMIEKQLADLAGPNDSETEQEPEADGEARSSDENGDLNYSAELRAAFDKIAGRQQEGADGDPVLSDGHVRNPDLRRERIREEIEAEKQGEPTLQDRFRRVPQRIWEAKDNAVRQFLVEQYGGECQICGYTFRKRDGTPYFEGLYLVSRRHARWVDRPGNVISLCATCCAKLQHGSVEADPDIVSQIEQWRTRMEGGSDNSLKLRLCGEDVELHFKEKHLLDLQEIVRSRS